MQLMKQVPWVLIVTIMFTATTGLTAHAEPRKSYQYKYISGEEACADFKEYRAAAELLKKAAANGQLDLGMGLETKGGIAGTIFGLGMMLPEAVVYARTKAFSAMTMLPIGVGIFVGGLWSILGDEDQKQVASVEELFKNPSGLLAKSDQEACAYLFEYPAMRSKIAEGRDAAEWALKNRTSRDVTVSNATDAKTINNAAAARAPTVVAGAKTTAQ